MDHKLEIVAFTIEGCIAAQQAGADRIELCENYFEGGTTPSYGFIQMARSVVEVELYPIIRPRGGGFCYSEIEFEMMKADVRCCKQLGCDGISTGILTPAGSLDRKRNAQLVSLASQMGVTLHRAFDRVADRMEAMEAAIDCGFERILTSGAYPSAVNGADNIKQLVEEARDRIIIMPGGGVRSSNLAGLAEATGAKEFHSSAMKKITAAEDFVQKTMDEEPVLITVDAEEVKQMKVILHRL